MNVGWNVDRRSRSSFYAVAWCAVMTLGCVPGLFGPGGDQESDPIEVEACSDDHDDYWEGDELAEIGEVSAEASCNELYFFSGGGGQGGGSTVFHIEPVLRIKSSDLQVPAEPAIFWTVTDMSGEVLEEQGIELYEYSIVDGPNKERLVQSQVFIGRDAAGKNIVLRAEMDLLDADGEPVTVAPQAAVLLFE